MPTGELQVSLRGSEETVLSTHAPPLELTTIPAVNPSLAEVLRLCPLRAGLSRADGADQLVLGNPKAWLGTAYHAVLEHAGYCSGANSEGAHEAAWLAAVDRQHDRAQIHPLDRRFGPPERWPGYHLVRAMALLRAREFSSTPRSPSPSGSPQGKGAGREQWLSGANGRLVGRPDVLRDDAVIDYKTGDVHEHDDTNVMKASYVRQLQLYGFLVKECTGIWPTRGVLLPMEGPPLEIELEPTACERVAADALELLARYNREVQAGGTVAALASPSASACKWCPYQVLCPAFWEIAGPSWIEPFGAAAVGGLASTLPRPIHGGATFALSLCVDEGSGPLGSVALAPLSTEVHTSLAQVRAGMRVRATGLARRADGTVVPTVRTVIARAEDLPAIIVPGAIESTGAQGPAG